MNKYAPSRPEEGLKEIKSKKKQPVTLNLPDVYNKR